MPSPDLDDVVAAADARVASAYAAALDTEQRQAAEALREALTFRSEVNDRIAAAAAGEHRIVRIDNGWRVQSTDEYVVEVWKTLFNWRLVCLLPNQQQVVEHGFCYFGLGLESLTRAIAAGLQWEDPFHTKPDGYDKQAF